MSIEFQLGSQVVCINDNWSIQGIKNIIALIGVTPIIPVKNRVYTIRILYPAIPTGLGLVFEEIVNSILCPKTKREVNFHHSHFRPVKKTNIDIFTSILEPQKDKLCHEVN